MADLRFKMQAGHPVTMLPASRGARAVADSLGYYCATMIRPGRTGAPGSQFGDPSFNFGAERVSAATGIPFDEASLYEIGERVCVIERAIVVRDGRTRKTDSIPGFFFKVPIPDGVSGRAETRQDEV